MALGSMTHTSAVARCGQLIFVGAITPHDPESGRVIEARSEVSSRATAISFGSLLADIQMDRVIAQSWRIYETLSDLLSGEGASLKDVLRQRILISDLRDLPAVEKVIEVVFGDDKPATTILRVHGKGVDPRIAVSIDAIALSPESGGVEKEVVRIPELEPATRGYPQATRAGQFVFVSQMAGIDREGRRATSLGEDQPAELQTANFRTAEEERVFAETWWVFQNISDTLETQSATLSDILKVNGWLTCDMRGYRFSSLAREFWFRPPALVPASAGLTIDGLPWEGASVAFDAIALVPDGAVHKENRLPLHDIVTTYVAVSGGGPLVLTAGEVPIDASGPRLISTFADLSDSGSLLAFGRIHEPQHFQARGWFVYSRLQEYLRAYDTSLDQVVHQTVYLSDPSQYPNIERVAAMFFGSKVPPTTLIPINDTSPYPEAKLEIEVIARAAQ